jgi:hypothetical protein
VYGTDLAVVRFLAVARYLALVAEGNGTTSTYELWDDKRPALSAFVPQMSGAD